MKDRNCFTTVLRGQLPAQSQLVTKGKVVSAEDSPGSSECAFDVCIPHMVPKCAGFCPSQGQSPPADQLSQVTCHIVTVTCDYTQNYRPLRCTHIVENRM